MSEATVAIRYAKSLIGLAQEQKVLDTVYQDMVLFKTTADENRGLMLALKSPVVRHEKKLALLDGIFKSRISPVSHSIFTIITKKNREALMFSIADEFIKLYNDGKGIVTASVTSAVALTEDLRAKIAKLVTDSTGKTVELKEKIDENLIGGYILRVGDNQIDASIRRQLSDLKVSFLG